MALRSGLAAQVGFVAETTYGTPVTVTRFNEFLSEGLKLDLEHVESSGLRSGNRILRTDRQAINKKGVSGDLEYEVASKGFGLLFVHALGAVATAAAGTLGKTHTCTLGDQYGKSLTVQVGRPDTAGTVQPFTYSGVKIDEWELSCELDDVLKLKLTLDGYDEVVTTPALASASYAAADELLYFTGATITVGGVSTDLTKFSVSGKNGLKKDRYFLRGSSLKKEPVAAEMAELTGELEAEFNGLTDYARFTSGATAAVVATFAGSLIEVGHNYSVTVTLPAVRFDGETPNISGPDVTMQPLPFKVLNNGTDEPITVVYKTTDAAP